MENYREFYYHLVVMYLASLEKKCLYNINGNNNNSFIQWNQIHSLSFS